MSPNLSHETYGDSKVLDWSDPVHSAIVDKYGADPDGRYDGYFYSQSVRKVMDHLDPEDIEVMNGSRTVQEDSRSLMSAESYVRNELQTKMSVDINYDRPEVREELRQTLQSRGGTFSVEQLDNGEVFSWDSIKRMLDEEDEVHDIPLSKLVFRIDDPDGDLETFWKDFLDAVFNEIGSSSVDTGWVESPFYAVMKAESPEVDKARRAVEDHHDERYFMRPHRVDESGLRGMGWEKRPMHLKALWSNKGYNDIGSTIATWSAPSGEKVNLTPRVVEENVFNWYDTDKAKYGAVNSKQFINKWRQSFSRGVTDLKYLRWEQSEGWVPVR